MLCFQMIRHQQEKCRLKVLQLLSMYYCTHVRASTTDPEEQVESRKQTTKMGTNTGVETITKMDCVADHRLRDPSQSIGAPKAPLTIIM